MTVALCRFRRNLRLDDNAALAAALRHADAVVPVVLTHDLEPDGAGAPARAALCDAAEQLARRLEERGSRLIVRAGEPARALADLARESGATVLVTPAAVEPDAKAADARIAAGVGALGVRLVTVEDRLLLSPSDLTGDGGRAVRVFTPWQRRFRERDKPAPLPEPARVETPDAVRSEAFRSDPLPAAAAAPYAPRGGELEARRTWTGFLARGLDRYAERRDRPGLDGTSRLSPHLAAGAIGVRRVFSDAVAAMRGAPPSGRASISAFLSELGWREFYAGILDAVPTLAQRPLRPEFERFPWVSGDEAERRFALFTSGRTGYPLVDAGMRQLLAEGWMHNRVRMVVASFLTKDLLLPWQRGERWFAERLADWDAASNAGGWQWSAGTGTDGQPFFRVFNPVLQGERFDPDGAYVRRFVPELANAAAPPKGSIHAPWLWPSPPADYPGPIVDHAAARAAALEAFGTIRTGAAPAPSGGRRRP